MLITRWLVLSQSLSIDASLNCSTSVLNNLSIGVLTMIIQHSTCIRHQRWRINTSIRQVLHRCIRNIRLILIIVVFELVELALAGFYVNTTPIVSAFTLLVRSWVQHLVYLVMPLLYYMLLLFVDVFLYLLMVEF